MIGIISSVALLAMFLSIILEERTRVQMCHASYMRRFDSLPRSKEERLESIAEELSLHTNVRHVATHGCVICQTRKELYTMSEALPYLEHVRANAF